MRNSAAWLVFAVLAACNPPSAATAPDAAEPTPVADAKADGPSQDAGTDANLADVNIPEAKAAALGPEESNIQFVKWLRERVPAGGAVVVNGAAPPTVTHTVAEGDTALTIAKAYLDLSDIYYASDFAAAIVKKNASLARGKTIDIPNLISAPYTSDPEKERLGWPENKVLRGVFVTGAYAGILWVPTLDKLAARKLNAVVLDGKDYMGPITYPTKVKLALEVDASKNFPIADLKRAIRFAHARGIHVIMRIACFHDPFMQKRAPRLSIMGTWGKPFDMGWLDPTNVEAQDYIIDLAKEQMDAGADEIQLDYIRFPVHGGLKSAVMPKPDGERIQAIKAFVRRIHEVTKPRKVALSLDIFGVTATGDRSDWEMLGQDIAALGPECEALSPMVYPSHYSAGFMGYAEPGNQPEIIGIGTKAAVGQLQKANVKGTIIRSWLQAFAWKAPSYGPKYVVDQAKQAESTGGTGWLMWSPSNDYNAVWQGFPVIKDKD